MTRFYNFLAALAVLLTPVAMMTAFGWTTYDEILKQTGVPWLALLSGLAAASSLETIGIVAGETALWFHGRNDRRWRGAAAVLLIYVLFSLNALRGTPLALLPLLAGAVYILIGLRAQAQREQTAGDADAQAGRAWEQEQWRIRQADKTAVRMAEVQAAANRQPASSLQAEPLAVLAEPIRSTNGHGPAASSSLYQCRHCDSTFPTMQALGGHVKAAHKER